MTNNAEATEALRALATSTEVAEILASLQRIQKKNDQEGTWEAPLARKVESAMGYLQMAIEAADPLAFQR